jgi:hypothetical protein
MTAPDAMPRPTFRDKLVPTPTKKLLALDGGGIRGLLTIEVLAGIEAMLRRERQSPQLVLADYFDYIAGTSTGAIIATCLSLGMSVDTVRDFYVANGSAMFDKASLLKRFRYKFEDDKLAAMLKLVMKQQSGGVSDPTLGTEALRTLLLIVMRNASTDSPWPISNNPAAKYNASDHPDCNLRLPLWQLVRASTAAPTYFPPEEVHVGSRSFLFVDGGVTTYNNPAFLLFLMATTGAYRLGWPTGAERMLLVSVGTGTSPNANADLDPSDLNLLYNAGSIPSALMYAALNEQDLLCRVFGRCRHGAPLDREVGALIDSDGQPSLGLMPKLFTYARYNAELTTEGLTELGLGRIRPKDVQKMDSVDHMQELQQVGGAVAKRVSAAHFAGFPA